jgi:hypothetical protein
MPVHESSMNAYMHASGLTKLRVASRSQAACSLHVYVCLSTKASASDLQMQHICCKTQISTMVDDCRSMSSVRNVGNRHVFATIVIACC